MTYFVYDAFGNLASEYGGTATAPSCTTCYVSVDHLGSTRVLTVSSGTVKERHDYMPFGEEMFAGTGARTAAMSYLPNTPGQAGGPKFTGQYRDPEMGGTSAMGDGLDFFGARYFSSAQGRFTSPDWSAKPQPVPYADIAVTPQTLNLYTYVRNNPLSRADKDGHCDFCDWLIVKASVCVARPAAVALALDGASDSIGIKTTAGVGTKIDIKGIQVGFVASVTSEVRNDGSSSSALQGTVGATVNGVGPQSNLTAKFVDNGGFVNPADNMSVSGKGVGNAPVVDNVKVTSAANDDGTALGVGVNAWIFQIGVQVTAGTQQIKDVASSVGNAIRLVTSGTRLTP